MNIGQIARTQKMLYNIANKNVSSGYSAQSQSSSSSKLAAYSGLFNGFGYGSTQDSGDNFFSSPTALQGTARQIARRLYDASFSSDAEGDASGAVSTQDAYASAQNKVLEALRKQLGTKVESQQQLYQPDQTLSGNFAQLQSVAEELVSRLQTVNLSDETTKKIQALALADAKNSAGAQTDNEGNATDFSQVNRLDMIQEEVQKFAPSRRAAALNTINKVWQSELERIGSYIKEKDPEWTIWGDKFDTSILDGYKPGINTWV